MLSHFIAETQRGPAAVSIACHNRIEFYLFESNFIRQFLPLERSGSTGPGETTVGLLKFNPFHPNPLPTGAVLYEIDIEKV